jgi:hypothetical protein
MNFPKSSAVVVLVLLASASLAHAGHYAALKAEIAERRAELAELWRGSGDRKAVEAAVHDEILTNVTRLAALWLGTRWGLGAPQLSEPGDGKINCGTFVGTVLRDAGFEVHVKKLQRQPSQLIIRSFVGNDRMKRFSNASMKRFLDEVRSMGPGLFIIGLDFHVGLLVQTEDDLRFVHASYETRTVVDEPAASAGPIVDSNYRVVGKILSDRNVRDWLEHNRIRVKGNW